MRPFPTLRLALFLILGCLMGPGARAQTERPEVGRYARVYQGGEGVTVTVLRMGPTEKNEALVQINGIDHPLDGKIRPHGVITQGEGRYDYQTSAEGGTRNTLLFRNGQITLYAPGVREAIPVAYSEALSREVTPQHFLTLYLEQKAGTKR